MGQVDSQSLELNALRMPPATPDLDDLGLGIGDEAEGGGAMLRFKRLLED